MTPRNAYHRAYLRNLASSLHFEARDDQQLADYWRRHADAALTRWGRTFDTLDPFCIGDLVRDKRTGRIGTVAYVGCSYAYVNGIDAGEDGVDLDQLEPETHACSDCFLGGAIQRRETGTHLCDSCLDHHMQVRKARQRQAAWS